MRFFTTITPAGRLEYFLVTIAIGIAMYATVFILFGLTVDAQSLEITYAVERMALTAFIYAGLLFLSVINALRRMKDLHMGSGWIVLAFIPLVSFIFSLMLLLSKGIDTNTYVPYGDNPYDPDSWVPNAAPSSSTGIPSVTLRGQALLLPGEEENRAA